ncbi:MAG: hypothetical protein HKN04_11290 [Rhodothermaceae bacterium]|nr:hypothetical protein [Rhodothermaceae bacterium]
MPTVVDHPLLKRGPALLCWIALGFWMGGCMTGESSAESIARSQSNHPADTLGTRVVSLYAPAPDYDDRCVVAEPQPGWLEPALTVEAALDSLGHALARGYFHEWNGQPTGIDFELVEVVVLPTPSDSMRIAVIDMRDSDRWGERGFFQGTTGGMISQRMISATFMQVPVALDEQPLLDGLVLLYNGERIVPMDHTRLDLIQQPDNVAICSN